MNNWPKMEKWGTLNQYNFNLKILKLDFIKQTKLNNFQNSKCLTNSETKKVLFSIEAVCGNDWRQAESSILLLRIFRLIYFLLV